MAAAPDFAPHSAYTNPMLTDLYQITMAYAYWRQGRHTQSSSFDLYFRRNPFKGEYTVFAGLEECLRLVHAFRFTPEHIAYLRTILPHAEDGYFQWLGSLDCSQVKIYAPREGSVVFPTIPLLIVEGPLGVCQLLETTLLNCVNYASLVTTNAVRFVRAAGGGVSLFEFGLRRAQGPDGAMSASRYSYLGGFAGTSNVLAGMVYGMPVRGTHAHAFVSSFVSFADLPSQTIRSPTGGPEIDFVPLVHKHRAALGYEGTNESELAAFVSYAQAFPSDFLALVDTYDTLSSGVPNFITVGLALAEVGYRAVGIRLDSGDLSYLSKQAREMFERVEAKFGVAGFGRCTIVASNDINEETLLSLNAQRHAIDVFGVGTHLVTCQAQPALGCVYKLVEIEGTPRIKLSEDIEKTTIPGRKRAYRLIGKDGVPLLDVLTSESEPVPQPGEPMLCRHAFKEAKRVVVRPTAVAPLHELWWDGRLVRELPSVPDSRAYCHREVAALRDDIVRSLNPTPYKVSVSGDLFTRTHALWMQAAPIKELQ